MNGLGLLKSTVIYLADLDPRTEAVAKGLEYALANACIAEVEAKQLGRAEDYKVFYERSQSYRDFYFDEGTKVYAVV